MLGKGLRLAFSYIAVTETSEWEQEHVGNREKGRKARG